MGSIRSEYIKNLMAEKNALDSTLAEATKESLRSILSESVNKGIRQILSEASDKFEEEEVTDDVNNGTEEVLDTETDVEKDGDKEEVEDNIETETETDETPAEEEETVESDEELDDDGDEEVWSRLEDYVDNDGEYDLTGMSDEDMIKVMKVVDPDKDGVRVVKNNDNTLTLTDDNNSTEYIIDLGGACEEDDEEFTIGESRINETNLGYTDDYQKMSAMTMPSDDNDGGQFDGGAPKGSDNNGKRWVGNAGDMAPYNESEEDYDDDEMVFEVEMDECGLGEDGELEEMTTVANGSRTLGTKGDTNHSQEDRQRHIHKNYDRLPESVDRKLKAIVSENKQLKGIAGQFKSKLDEAVVMNASLAKIIKLVTENSTTKDEKMDIVKRFNNVTNLDECQSLYESIDAELKKNHPINSGVDKLIASKVNESKPQSKKDMIVETTLLNSKELSDTIDLMKRMDKVK